MIRKAWLISAILCLMECPAFAQIGVQGTQVPRPRVEEYAIRGKIMTGTGRDGDMRIEVRLERSTMQVVQVAYTDSVGNFEFRNLSQGTYWVNITHEGFEPVRQSVDLFANMGNHNLSIFLNRAPVERPRLSPLDAADPNIVDVSQMRENFPKKATQNFEKALEERKKGQNEKAILLLEEAVEIAPTFYRAHNTLGVLYQNAKRFEDAVREFRRAQELNPKSAEPLTNLGSLFIEQSDRRKADGEEVVGKLLDDALDALEAAVKVEPRSSLALYFLGLANYKSSFWEEAEAALTKALAVDPSLNRIRLMLANTYLKQNKWQDVLDMLDAYLLNDPKAGDRTAVEATRARIQQGLEAGRSH